jgi:phosphomannomutase
MIHFGTGGFRAVIGQDFTQKNLEKIAGAICRLMKRDGKVTPVVIGYDRRFLSDLAAQWMASVFAAHNIEVHLINFPAPTPMVMFEVMHEGAEYGIAVTASHNPAIYNGVKLFTKGGRDATETVTRRVEEEIRAIWEEDIPVLDFRKAVEKGIVRFIQPQNDYIDSILSLIDTDVIKKRGLRILLDPMYGVGKTTLQTILHTCRCNVDVIHERHDPLFGGRVPAPMNSTLGHLEQLVIQGKYDLGIATDGDADRIGLIDNQGNYIQANDILVLLYYYLHEYKGWKGGVVRNIATTACLDRMAQQYGEQCWEVPVGFKHISKKMEETNALIGGESSGGLTVRGHIHGKDGIYAGTLLVEMLSTINKPLSEILDQIHQQFGNFAMAEYNYTVDFETTERLKSLLFKEKKLPEFGQAPEKVSYLDGCKVYFRDGWIICRFSGTEPVVRIFCETQSFEESQRRIGIFRDFLHL